MASGIARRRLALVGLVSWFLLLSGCKEAPAGMAPASSSEPANSSSRIRKGGTDVTFLVTADTHFGYGVQDKDPGSKRAVSDVQGIESAHLRAIRSMNGIEGRPFPKPGEGVVGHPLGLLAAGDLTDTSHPAEWARFAAFYGRNGNDGLLRYPVYETWGNHDKFHDSYVRKRIEERHGQVRYTIDWQDLHVVCLGEAPDHDDLLWLENDLRTVGKEVGVVLFMHYPLYGPFSLNNWFGRGDYRDRLAETLQPYSVLGIFHGHYHVSERYRWHGYDVYNVGSPKHGYERYAVVRVTDEQMVVGSWDYRDERWGWVHSKAW